jgi:carboxylesterase
MNKCFLMALTVFSVVAAIIAIYNTVIGHMMRCHTARTERDPRTGIVRGAEPVVLKGSSAKKAALLIHGFIGSPTDYGRLPALLHRQGYDVFVPLLPGHGTDPEDFSKTTADELEAFVLREYRALKQKYAEVVLIGFSMGGALSVLTAAKEPVDALVLLAPYFKISHQWYYVFPTEVYQKIFKQLIPYTYRPITFKQINNKNAIPYIVDYDYVSLRGAEAAIELGSRAAVKVKDLRQPTLILHSTNDRAVDYRASQKAADYLKNVSSCHLVTLNRSNHILLWDHDMEMVETAILEFVTQPKALVANGGKRS